MIPGEIIAASGEIELNAGAPTVTHRGLQYRRPPGAGRQPLPFLPRPMPASSFDRDKAHGMRLDIPAGTAVRFEPGQTRSVTLIPLSGKREVYGFRQLVMGRL